MGISAVQRSARVALAIVLAAAIAAVSASEASATGTVTCQGTQISTYSPPLKRTPQRITIRTHTIVWPCLSVGTSIESGYSTSEITREDASCNSLGGGPDDKVFHWNGGLSSSLRLTATTVRTSGQVVITDTGTVDSGALEGGTAVGVLTLTGIGDLLDNACDREGIDQLAGTYTLNVVDLL
jgi:hypothetical protein